MSPTMPLSPGMHHSPWQKTGSKNKPEAKENRKQKGHSQRHGFQIARVLCCCCCCCCFLFSHVHTLSMKLTAFAIRISNVMDASQIKILNKVWWRKPTCLACDRISYQRRIFCRSRALHCCFCCCCLSFFEMCTHWSDSCRTTPTFVT